MQRLKEAAEKAKKELSTVTSSNINLPFITMNQDGPKHLDITLSRAKFDELTADLVDRTMGPVRNALSDAGLSASELDKILLVGGSTRIPAVQDAVKKITGKEMCIRDRRNATREDVGVIFGKALSKVYTVNQSAALKYNDKNAITASSVPYLELLNRLNLMVGDANNNFNPKANINLSLIHI